MFWWQVMLKNHNKVHKEYFVSLVEYVEIVALWVSGNGSLSQRHFFRSNNVTTNVFCFLLACCIMYASCCVCSIVPLIFGIKPFCAPHSM